MTVKTFDPIRFPASATVTPEALFPDYDWSGGGYQDHTPQMQAVIEKCKSLRKSWNKPIVLNLQRMYQCQKTVKVEQAQAIKLYAPPNPSYTYLAGGGFIRTLNDDTGALGLGAQLDVVNSDNIEIENVEIQGTHDSGAKDRDTEGERALWLRSSFFVNVLNPFFHHTEGDMVSFGAEHYLARGGCHDVTIRGGKFWRSGRCIISHLCENFRWDGTNCGFNSASFVDIETGGPVTRVSSNMNVSNLKVYGTSGLFFHITGTTKIKGLHIWGCHGYDKMLSVDCVPGTGQRYEDLWFTDNTWDGTITAGHAARWWHVDGLHIKRNAGPVGNLNWLSEISDCTKVEKTPNSVYVK